MLKDLDSRIAAALQKGVNAATAQLKQEIDRLTPEDTRRLVGNNRAKSAVITGQKVVGAVVNDTEYALYVEYGVRGKAYRYHKPKGSVAYVGVGARMFARGYDGKKKELMSTISNSIKQSLKNA